MEIKIESISKSTLLDAKAIWNEVVLEGKAFPQIKPLQEDAETFFDSQSYTGVAINVDTNQVVGMYILHPNNVGRCGHICNASYAVKGDLRGQHLGEYLVKDCIKQAKLLGYKILQFNAVVASNVKAIKLYKKLGFKQLGVIPNGFYNINGEYEDIIPHYIEL